MSDSDWFSSSGLAFLVKEWEALWEYEMSMKLSPTEERRMAGCDIEDRENGTRARLMGPRYLRLVDRHNEWMVSAFIAGSGEVSSLEIDCSLTDCRPARLLCSS